MTFIHLLEVVTAQAELDKCLWLKSTSATQAIGSRVWPSHGLFKYSHVARFLPDSLATVSNPGFPLFWSFHHNCKPKSRTESLGSKLVWLCESSSWLNLVQSGWTIELKLSTTRFGQIMAGFGVSSMLILDVQQWHHPWYHEAQIWGLVSVAGSVVTFFRVVRNFFFYYLLKAHLHPQGFSYE